MSTHSFTPGTRFSWNDAVYEITRRLSGNRLNFEDIETGEVRTAPLLDLVDGLYGGEIQFETIGRLEKSREIEEIDFSDYSPDQQELANFRLRAIRPLLSKSRAEVDIQQRVTCIKGKRTFQNKPRPISVPSMYRWLRDYEASGKDIRSLVPGFQKRGGVGESRLHPIVEEIIEDTIKEKYFTGELTTVKLIHREVAARVDDHNRDISEDDRLSCPSPNTIWRRVNKSDLKRKLIAKRGRKAGTEYFKQFAETPYPTIPLDRVEIDHTKIDLIVVDEEDGEATIRLTLTFCLDTATRYPLGYYLGPEPPSYRTVLECLYRSILPKGDLSQTYSVENEWLAHGIPRTLVVDNGKEFIGKDLKDACNSLGITIERNPVRTPRFKAAVERIYHTINTGVFHTLPGTTFSNPLARGSYKSLDEAVISMSELDEILHIFLVDIYAQQVHTGIEMTPARAWNEAIKHGFTPRLPESAHELRVLLGRTSRRTIRPWGVSFLGIRYNSDDISGIRIQLDGQKAKIKYHPGNLSTIYVYDPDARSYIPVPALDQEYTKGLSLWMHRICKKYYRKHWGQEDTPELGRARRRIDTIVARSKARRMGKSMRATEARWQGNGAPTQMAEKPFEKLAPDHAGSEKVGTHHLGIELENLGVYDVSESMKVDGIG